MTIQLLNQEKKNFTIINMEYKITLSYSEQQEVELFCKLNNITTDELIKKSFKTGYNIEKYGLVGKMGGIQEKWVEKEVIQEKWVEIPVEVIKEVIKVEYVEVPVEKIVEVIKEIPVDKVVIKEVIKEVPVEKVVTKIEYISDKTSENELYGKIVQLENEKQEFSTKLQECDSKLGIFSTKTTEMENPSLSEFKTPYGVAPFDLIKAEHYLPAYQEAIKQHKKTKYSNSKNVSE